jgi:hypothetical protein
VLRDAALTGGREGDDDGTVVALHTAARSLEGAVATVLVGLVRDARAGRSIIASDELVAFVALAWATGELVRNCTALGLAVAGLQCTAALPPLRKATARVPGIPEAFDAEVEEARAADDVGDAAAVLDEGEGAR